MTLVVKTPIAVRNETFDPLRERIAALIPARRRAAFDAAWGELEVAISQAQTSWYEIGRWGTQCDEYARGRSDGARETSEACIAILNAVPAHRLCGTGFDPEMPQH